MADATGAQTKTGLGLETAYGTQVKAQVLLDARNNTIAGEYDRIQSQALKSGRMRRPSVAGAARIGGGFQCEVTPDGFTRVLLAAVGSVSTTGAADPYTHTFSPPAAGPKPVTLMRLMGDIIAVHSCLINQIAIRAELDEMALADVEVVGKSERITTSGFDASAFGAAAYAADPAFTFVQAEAQIGGVKNCDVSSCVFTLNNNLDEKRTFCSAFPANQGPGMLDLTYEMDMYFSSDLELRKYLGVAAGAAYPYVATTTTLTSSVSLEFTAGANRSLKIASAACEVEAPLPPVESPEYLRQRVVYRARDLAITVKNAETNAVLTTAGTAIVWP